VVFICVVAWLVSAFIAVPEDAPKTEQAWSQSLHQRVIVGALII
jgi:hypothetical protein